MKIAVTCQNDSLESPVDPRFGRASGFMVFDTESKESSWCDNAQNLQLAQGAGIQAAMNVAKTGAKTLITGHVGPKAYKALNKGGVEIFFCTDATVAEALKRFEQGALDRAQGADVDGHW